MCFFFQAVDGIRGLGRSRGLGDVYKRQVQGLVRDQIRGSGTNITTMSNFGDDLENQVQVNITEDSVTVTVTYDFPTWFGGIVRLDTIRIRKVAVMPVYGGR